MLRPQTPDPLLSTSDKSGQKRLSAHFAISKNISLRSILVKFEAEPISSNKKTARIEPKIFSFVRFIGITIKIC